VNEPRAGLVLGGGGRAGVRVGLVEMKYPAIFGSCAMPRRSVRRSTAETSQVQLSCRSRRTTRAPSSAKGVDRPPPSSHVEEVPTVEATVAALEPESIMASSGRSASRVARRCGSAASPRRAPKKGTPAGLPSRRRGGDEGVPEHRERGEQDYSAHDGGHGRDASAAEGHRLALTEGRASGRPWRCEPGRRVPVPHRSSPTARPCRGDVGSLSASGCACT
jgi:hypothetical protein